MRRRFEVRLNLSRPAFTIGDVLIVLLVAALLYLGVRLAVNTPLAVTDPNVSLAFSALPWYALLSVGRMTTAYQFSLRFTLVYGYLAARHEHNLEEAVFMADRIVVMDKEPGRVVADVPVTLQHPRHRKDAVFQAMVDKVYAAVAGKTEPEAEALGTAPGLLGTTLKLPGAPINRMAGLLEKVNEEDGKTDLYRLAGELNLELDDVLPVVEAAELMGFAAVDQGDIILTPLGQAFADASILARKEMIAGRTLRLPTIRWMYETLQQAVDHRVEYDNILETLRVEFGDLAEEQFDTAVNWSRYAELFAYDDDSGELYLENNGGPRL